MNSRSFVISHILMIFHILCIYIYIYSIQTHFTLIVVLYLVSGKLYDQEWLSNIIPTKIKMRYFYILCKHVLLKMVHYYVPNYKMKIAA